MQKVLLGGASLLAIGAMVGPALAQVTGAGVETVVVTGIRASLQSAQSIKQNSDQVVDSITAVDIGALPDRNVADALQRVPGVTLQRTDQNRDPVRYGGTGNGVFIRGLSWVSNLTNGRDTFSATNGRSLSFADVSADLLSGIDVYKNPDAKMIEGGIGGTVDLKTRKPFDQDGRLIAFSADYTYGDLISKGTPSANALFSDRWNSKIGEFGVLVSVDWQDQMNRTNGISTTHYDCVNRTTGTAYNAQVDATGFASCQALNAGTGRVDVPNYAGYRAIDWEQQRFATDINLQWCPNDKWEFTFEALNAVANPHDTEYAAGISVSQSTAAFAGYTFAPDGTWTGGSVHNVGYAFDTRIGKHHDRTTDLSLNAKFNPNDSWAFSADVQYTESVATNYSLTAYTDPDTSKTDVNFMFDLARATPTVTSASTGLATKANYYWLAAMDHMEYNYAHSFAYRADGTYTFHDQKGWLKSIAFGVRGEDKQAITRQTGYNWAALSPAWGSGFGPLYLDNTFGGGAGWNARFAPSAALLTSTHLQNFGSFLGGTVPSLWMVNASLLNKGMAHAYSVLQTAENSWWYWVPYSVKNGCATSDVTCFAAYQSATPAGDNQSSGINNQKEDTLAGYAQFNYGHDTFLGFDIPVDGNIGVRIVSTKNTADAGRLIINWSAMPCTSPPATSCADYNTAYAFTGGVGGSLNLPAAKGSYTDILPSFNFRAHLTDQLQARLAFSQSMVRPDFSYTQNFANVSYAFGANPGPLEGTFKSGSPSGNAGNPYLKPMHSNNYDASLEWYFAPTGSVTFALFHKDISDYFYTTAVPFAVTNPATHLTETFNMTTTVNGNKGKVEGFELAYQQFFDALPGVWGGLGFQANYTKIYNSGGANPTVNLFDGTQVHNAVRPLPMEGMSNDSYNLALLYEKFGFSGRLAYNWRSKFLLTSSAANVNQPIWSENYGQLDGSLLYTFMEHYKIGVQVTNILKTQTVLDVGYADYHPKYDWIETDRKFSVVLRANW